MFFVVRQRVHLGTNGSKTSLVNEDLNFPRDLFTFTKKVFNRKYHFCIMISMIRSFPRLPI